MKSTPREIIASSLSPKTKKIDSETEITIDPSTNGEKKQSVNLKIPENLNDDVVCNAIFYYVKYHLIKIIDQSVLTHIYLYIRFFLFVEKKFPLSNSLPNSIFQEYRHFLGNVQELNPSSIRQYMTSFRVALTCYLDSIGEEPSYSKRDKRHLISTIEKIPSIPITPGTPRKALSQIIDTIQYDDNTLLDSANRFCTCFLQIIQEHRMELLQSPKVCETLDLLISSEENLLSNTTWQRKYSDLQSYLPIFDAVYESDSITLKERLLCSDAVYRDVISRSSAPLHKRVLNKLLKLSCTQNEELRINKVKFQGDAQLLVTFEGLDYKSLLLPTPAEEICLGWLLAADRIQESGLHRMKVSELEVTMSHAVGHYKKLRSSKIYRDGTAHKKNTRQYKCYKNITGLRNNFNTRFASLCDDRLFTSNSRFECLLNHNSSVYRLICVAAFENTALQLEIIRKDPLAKAFLELLKAVNDQNNIYRLNRIKYQDSINHSENGRAGQESWAIYMKTPSANIPVGAFSQSRAIISDESFDVDDPYDRFTKEYVDAENTGHTIRTKQETYKARSETTHRISKRVAFSKQVGDLMENDARKVISILSKTKFISYMDLKSELGWAPTFDSLSATEDFNDLIESAESNGFCCTPFGALEKNEQRYIIALPITVALMLSYREECDRVIPQVDSDELALSLKIQSVYITELLKNFDSKTLLEGREIFSSSSFPSPSLY